MLFALFGQSMSSVWLGILLILVFAVKLRWLPAMGSGSISNLILPCVTLGASLAALVTRMVRSGMIDVLQEDYITATYARGISPAKVIFKYAFRNAMLPTITIVGMEVGMLLGGSVVIERIFGWPGIGSLTVQAGFQGRKPRLTRTPSSADGVLLCLTGPEWALLPAEARKYSVNGLY